MVDVEVQTRRVATSGERSAVVVILADNDFDGPDRDTDVGERACQHCFRYLQIRPGSRTGPVCNLAAGCTADMNVAARLLADLINRRQVLESQ